MHIPIEQVTTARSDQIQERSTPSRETFTIMNNQNSTRQPLWVPKPPEMNGRGMPAGTDEQQTLPAGYHTTREVPALLLAVKATTGVAGGPGVQVKFEVDFTI